MPKRLFCLLLAVLMTAALVGCTDTERSDKDVRIVCAAFAEYDWVKNLVDTDNADITLLTDTGTDMHSYQPTAADIAAISGADIVVYTGGTADSWMTDTLNNSGNTDAGLRLMDVLSDRLLCQPTVGAEHEHDHDHHDHGQDEHVWLSLKNAQLACDAIYERLCKVDSENVDGYRDRYESYSAKLAALDAKYTDALGKEGGTVVFADRFPFVYLFNDYDIGFFAAFPGCSSETDADFETVVSLAAKLDELQLDTVMIIDDGDRKLAQTVIANTKGKDQKILSLDSLQSVTSKDVKSGKSYLAAMEKNLTVLKQAL